LWLPLCGFTPTATPGALALLGRGMGWGNAGVGNLTVGFVPGADVAKIPYVNQSKD